MNSLYINKCKAFIDFMLTQQQWSGLTKAAIDSWLSNFRGLPLEEQELVYKLLKYSLQGTTQGRYLTGGVPPVRFSM